MNGNSEAVDMLAMTNGVLRNSLAGSQSTLTVTPTGGAHDTNAVILNSGNNVFDVPFEFTQLDIVGNVTGTGSLVKSGLGVVNLQGDNSYTGNTTVANGTLILNSPFLAATATVTVNTNALLGNNGVLNLNFAGSETNTVNALVLGGVSKPEGVYSATTDPPAGLSIPLETSVTVGAEIGWTNGQTFSTPITEFVAPHVSDPTLFDAVSISAKAWVEARLEVNLSVAGGLANAGPSLGIRAEAVFAVEPLNNPWWTLTSGADLVGAFELNFLGLNVAHVEVTNHIATFFHADAGVSASSDPVNIAATAGRNVRWGLALSAATASGEAYNKGFVTALAGGGYCIGGGHPIPAFLGVVSAEGHAVWMQDFPNGAKPVDGLQLADGSLMIAGYTGLNWWLAKYNTNGTRQWVTSHRVSGDLRDLEIGTAGNGDPEFYLSGFSSQGLVTQSDPVVLKFDKDGNPLWSKAYVLAKDDEIYAMRKLADGNFAIVGRTDSRVGTNLFIGAGNNGLIMKISPAGEVLWASAVAGRWGILYRDVAEAPDGSIFAVGANGDLVTDLYPSIMVAKFSADGSLVNHVLIGEDPDGIYELPNGGDTPYDTATQAAWTSNGIVVVGRTGLGVGNSAFAMCVTEELGVRWFSAFDGPAASLFEDVAVNDSGIAALGWAEDVWPIKFADRSPAWLLSLPWEGIMRFHPDSGVRSTYLRPHVLLSSDHADFRGQFSDAQGHQYFQSTAPVPFVISNMTIAVGGTITEGVFRTFDTARLEYIPPSIIDNYDEWAAYYQLSGTNSTSTSDPDGDGLNNDFEFFFGTVTHCCRRPIRCRRSRFNTTTHRTSLPLTSTARWRQWTGRSTSNTPRTSMVG